MHPAHRLAPCAALLLAAAVPPAHAIDTTGPYAAAIESTAIASAAAPDPLGARVTVATPYVARGTAYPDLGAKHAFGPGLLLKLHAGDGRAAGSGSGVRNWRDLAAGLGTKLEGGWTVAMNLSRAIGGTGAYDRYSTGNVRADGRPWAAGAGRRAITLSLTRRF